MGPIGIIRRLAATAAQLPSRQYGRITQHRALISRASLLTDNSNSASQCEGFMRPPPPARGSGLSSAYSTLQQESGSAPAPSEDVLYKSLEIEVASHDPAVLKSYDYFAGEAARLLDISFESSCDRPMIIERNTLPKSRHVHAKYHKVQYERRTHFRTFHLQRLTGSTADTYLEYIQRNLPEGVAMKVTKTRLMRLPDHIKPPEGESTS